jgi:tRNA-2-methylthio-N6-dimethylallyladenosine synthase
MKDLIKDIDILTPVEKEVKEEVKITEEQNTGKKRKLYIESYGCQMNFSDSEIVSAIMQEQGFDTTSDIEKADVVFLNTCSIRENAEQKVRARLSQINQVKRKNPEMMVGVLGCMAERLKSKLLEEEKIVDMVVGPDAYRDLPNLINEVDDGGRAVNVFLSREETYADISPVRLNSNGITALISIMRGCDNMCSFCVVPYTRGRERSRDPFSIIKEAQDLYERGYKEVTLLGQNVDSYKWSSEDKGININFAQLLEKVALVSPDLRVRFSTSHPKDITDEVLYTIKKYENICNYVHLPSQSGNNRILELMNRTYTREWYMDRISAIRNIVGESCGISTDMITGFCSETEEEHQDSLSLMAWSQYDFAYMFAYSERPGTPAAKKLKDDIAEDVKKRRLSEIIALQQKLSFERNKKDLHKVHKVLVEGYSKKSDQFLAGRNSENKVVVFPKKEYKKGSYVNVYVNECTPATLLGEGVD